MMEETISHAASSLKNLPPWAKYGLIGAVVAAILYIVYVRFRGGNGGTGTITGLASGSPSGGAEQVAGGSAVPATDNETQFALHQELEDTNSELAGLRDQFNSLLAEGNVSGDTGTGHSSDKGTGGNVVPVTSGVHVDSSPVNVHTAVVNVAQPITVQRATTESRFAPSLTAGPRYTEPKVNYNPPQNQNVTPTKVLSTGANTVERSPFALPPSPATVIEGVVGALTAGKTAVGTPNKSTKPGPTLGGVNGKKLI